ncbi:hypothetical protein FS749_015751, partial [Ceratobasidium sp. UAMH 11750]
MEETPAPTSPQDNGEQSIAAPRHNAPSLLSSKGTCSEASLTCAEKTEHETSSWGSQSLLDDEGTPEEDDQDRLDETIRLLIERLRGQTEREEALSTLGLLLSLVTEMEDVELWIYRSYISISMPKSGEIGAYTNSDLVRMFGQVTNNSSELTSQHYDGTIAWLLHSAGVLLTDFNRNNLRSLDQAKACLERAILLCSPRHRLRPSVYNNLAKVLRSRFQRLGELEDLSDALKYQHQAVSLAPLEANPLSALYLNNLGSLYRTQFDRLGQLGDVNHAISLHSQAISRAGQLKGDLPRFYAGLGEAYEARYGRLADLDDIQSAIQTHQHATFLAQKYGYEEARCLLNLGGSYRHRFERLGNVADIEKAIGCLLEAVEHASNDEVENATYLSELAVTYRVRYEHLGILEDINESISRHDQSLALLPDNHSLRPLFLFRLGQALEARGCHSGKLEDIDSAITCHLTAISFLQDDHEYHDYRINLLDSGLGSAYESRFDRLGDRSDIDKSVTHRMMAVRLTPNDHSYLPARLMGLALSYISRHQRLGELRDIDEAISLQLRAISIIPDDHASKPSFLDSLGIAYMRRFEQGSDEADLDQAILSQLQSVTLQSTAEGQELPLALTNLCASYIRRFKLHEKLDDINKAIEAGVRARALAPDDDVILLSNLGNAYKLRFGSLEDSNDLNMSIDAYSTAALLPTSNPSFRYHTAREWAQLSSLHQLPSALPAHQRVMELLPQVVWLGTSVQHRYRDISALGGSVAEAVSAAIEWENYELALEWFEQGRSIVWKQTLQLRTPLGQLRDINPELADRIESVGRALDRAMKPQSVGVAMEMGVPAAERSAQRHRQLAQEWENLMDDVYETLGEGNPYRPRKAASLVRAARTGPVIGINVHAYGCDALVVKPDSTSVACVPLPSLSLEKL